MKYFLVLTMALCLAACGNSGTESSTDPSISDMTFDIPEGVMTINDLKTPAAFVDISDDTERSAALFSEMSKVLLHPRCANCHPREGGPTQGDNMEPHNPPIDRVSDIGPDGMMCVTCHGPVNATYASMEGSVPGAEPWHLAPESMGWAGMTDLKALCENLKDESKNGGKSLADLVHHNGVDHLVGWAWEPGEGRSPAPGSQELLGALTKAWAETGGHCPG